MSKLRPVDSIRNRQDVEKYAREMDWEIRQGKRHGIIVAPKGQCSYPRHNGDFCTGTRWAIIKTLAAMSILSVIVFQFV